MNVGTTTNPQPDATGQRVLANAIEYQNKILTTDLSVSITKISSRIDSLFELLKRIHTDAKIPQPDYAPEQSGTTESGSGLYIDVLSANLGFETLIHILNDHVARFDSALTALQQYI